MRRTEALQGVRMMRFLDILGRYEAAEFNQLEARRACQPRNVCSLTSSSARYEEEGEAGFLDRRLSKASGKRVPGETVILHQVLMEVLGSEPRITLSVKRLDLLLPVDRRARGPPASGGCGRSCRPPRRYGSSANRDPYRGSSAARARRTSLSALGTSKPYPPPRPESLNRSPPSRRPTSHRSSAGWPASQTWREPS